MNLNLDPHVFEFCNNWVLGVFTGCFLGYWVGCWSTNQIEEDGEEEEEDKSR